MVLMIGKLPSEGSFKGGIANDSFVSGGFRNCAGWKKKPSLLALYLFQLF
jgi:hypothetical protein